MVCEIFENLAIGKVKDFLRGLMCCGCIGEINSEFISPIQDDPKLYAEDFDSLRTMICFDEKSNQFSARFASRNYGKKRTGRAF